MDVPVRRRDDPDIHGQGLPASHPEELLALEDPQQFRLEVEGELAHLVEEERAAVGEVEEPLGRPVGSGERAALEAEELALEERLGERCAIEGYEVRVAPGREPVERAGEELLSRAALPREQDVRTRRCDLPDEVEDVHDGEAPADEVLLPRGRFEPAPQGPVLLEEAAVRKGPARRQEELVGREGLREVVERPTLHRFHRRRDLRVRRDDDDREAGVRIARRRHEVEAVHPGHAEVHEGEVERSLPEERECLLAASRRPDLVACPLEDVAAGRDHLPFVVDDEDPLGPHGPLRSAAGSAAGSTAGSAAALACRRTVTRVPRPRWLSIRISPPRSRTMP